MYSDLQGLEGGDGEEEEVEEEEELCKCWMNGRIGRQKKHSGCPRVVVCCGTVKYKNDEKKASVL